MSYRDENMREQEINYFVKWARAKCHLTVFQGLFSALKSQSGRILEQSLRNSSAVLIAVSSKSS